MKTNIILNAAFAVAMLLTVASCKKTAVEEPQWFRNHTRFYYDLETDSSVEEGSRLLSVSLQNDGRDYFFYERPADTGSRTWYAIFGIFGNGFLKPMPDGLYRRASTTCNVGLISNSFEFLTIPAKPESGARIPQYACERREDGQNEILASDTLISVPAGSFRTFCVLHPNGDRSWWNRDIGIIMYRQKTYGVPFPVQKSCTLKLRRMD